MNTAGILLMAYGSPASLDDVEPYYTHIRGGRAPSPEKVEELRERYRRIGGRSPLLDITQTQAAALSARLGVPVYVGMKHWHPFIAETVDRMYAEGIRIAAAIALAPHFSAMSIGAYINAARQAAERLPGLEMRFVESWHLEPRFIDAVAHRVAAARRLLDDAERAPVIFTAHSLPKRILDWNDPYVAQLVESSRAVASAAEVRAWSFAFQSASETGEPWLGPDIQDAIRERHRDTREMVVCPIGFVADHLEVLYDIDLEATALAASLNARLVRTESLNAAPDFIEALAAVASRRLDEGLAR